MRRLIVLKVMCKKEEGTPRTSLPDHNRQPREPLSLEAWHAPSLASRIFSLSFPLSKIAAI